MIGQVDRKEVDCGGVGSSNLEIEKRLSGVLYVVVHLGNEEG